MEVPVTKYFPQKFRGPTSSADYNEFSRMSLEDISTLFNMLSANISNLEDLNKLYVTQFAYLSMKYQSLLASYNNLYGTLNSFTVDDSGQYHISYYNTNNISYGGFPSYQSIPASERCNINAQYGVLLPYFYSQVSRLFLHDDITGYTFVPKSLNQYDGTGEGEVVVRIKDNGYNYIHMSDMSKLFDCEQDTVWYIEARYPNSSNITSMEIILDVPLPVEIVNSLDCNYVIAEPYPCFGTSIESIKYTQDHRGQILYGVQTNLNSNNLCSFTSGGLASWVTIDAFTKKDYDTLYSFNSKPITGLRVHLKTDTYTVYGNERTFVVGLRNLDCGYLRLAPSRCLNKIELTSNSFKKIVDPKATSGNNTTIEYNLFYDIGSGDLIPYEFGAPMPLGIHIVYIETMLETCGLNGLNIEYEIY